LYVHETTVRGVRRHLTRLSDAGAVRRQHQVAIPAHVSLTRVPLRIFAQTGILLQLNWRMQKRQFFKIKRRRNSDEIHS
jgi:hypothetical protein